ncbi:MAG: ThuA domain-containing protein [Mucilaginibacter polytrichastri]|nr:ThuA domain-containing protein [Mucilaginibacter polytrichastri]
MKKPVHILCFCLAAMLLLSMCFRPQETFAQPKKKFNVIAFFTAKNDKAHISFVREANKWFKRYSSANGFVYDTTSNWSNMNAAFLSKYSVVLFLDTRPEQSEQRAAFEQYMKQGGAWMGFHFSAFALTPSACPQNWDWYHQEFLGSGEYVSNTWRPTAAVLRVEDRKHPVVKSLPPKFRSSPNEWYRWSNDLRKNPDLDVLLAIDSSSFPLGTGPKKHEIWHSGYYPVVWTNRKYHMVYFNMGHNDIDYEHGTNRELSQTFDNPLQNQLILQAISWLAATKQR